MLQLPAACTSTVITTDRTANFRLGKHVGVPSKNEVAHMSSVLPRSCERPPCRIARVSSTPADAHWQISKLQCDRYTGKRNLQAATHPSVITVKSMPSSGYHAQAIANPVTIRRTITRIPTSCQKLAVVLVDVKAICAGDGVMMLQQCNRPGSPICCAT